MCGCDGVAGLEAIGDMGVCEGGGEEGSRWLCRILVGFQGVEERVTESKLD